MAQSGLPTGTVEAIFKIVDQASPVVFDAANKIGRYLEKVEKSMQNGATSTRQFNTALDQFSGKNVAAKAYAYANAVGAIGGASKLTAKEQETVNRVVTEALDKFRVLGKEAPAELVKLATATKQMKAPVEQATSWWAKFGDQVKATALGFLSAQAITGLVKGLVGDTLQYAGAISDLSSQTHIGVVALQELDFAGGQVGITLDEITRGVGQMQKRIGSGEATKALDAIGLSLQTIRTLKPEDQFFAIAQKVAAIKDPAAQVNTAIALFGRQGMDLLPLITANLNELRGAASTMSAETVAALDTLGDQLDALKNKARAGFGGALVWLAQTGEWAFDVLVSGAARAIEKITSGLSSFYAAAAAVTGKIPGMSALAKLLESQATTLKQESTYWKDWADAAATAAENVGKVEPPVRRSAAAVAGLTDNMGRNKPVVDKAAAALLEYTRRLDRHIATMGDAVSLQQTYNQSLVTNIQNGLLPTAAALELVTGKFRDQYGVIGDLNKQLVGLAPAITGNIDKAFKDAAKGGGGFLSIFKDLGPLLSQGLTGGGGIGGAVNAFATQTASQFIDFFAPGLGTALGPVISTVFGKVGGFFKGLFGKSAGRKELEEYNAKIKDFGQQWIEAAGGIEQARERARAFGFDLDGILGNQGKQGLKNLQGDLGTIDEKWERLQAAMDKYGISVEQLGPKFKQIAQDDWADQLVADYNILIEAGASNETVIKKQAEEINQFVARSLRMGTEIPDAMIPMLQKMIDMGLLVDENGHAITDLEGSALTFSKTMTEAMDGVTAAIDRLPEAIARALGKIPDSISIPVDVPVNVHGNKYHPDEELPGYALGTHGYEYFGAGTPVMLHGWEKVTPRNGGGGDGATAPIYITVQSQLDGRIVAENQVRYMPSVLARAGVRN